LAARAILRKARGLADGGVPICSRFFEVPFCSRAHELVVAPERLLTCANALAAGRLAARRCALVERDHLLECRGQGFDLELVRREAAFKPNQVRILIQYWYPTRNLVAHMLPINKCFAFSGGSRSDVFDCSPDDNPGTVTPEGVERRSGAVARFRASSRWQNASAHPLASGARRRFGAPCGDFWLGTRFRERLRKRD